MLLDHILGLERSGNVHDTDQRLIQMKDIVKTALNINAEGTNPETNEFFMWNRCGSIPLLCAEGKTWAHPTTSYEEEEALDKSVGFKEGDDAERFTRRALDSNAINQREDNALNHIAAADLRAKAVYLSYGAFHSFADNIEKSKSGDINQYGLIYLVEKNTFEF